MSTVKVDLSALSVFILGLTRQLLIKEKMCV